MSNLFKSLLINSTMSDDLKTELKNSVTVKKVKKGTSLQVKGDRVIYDYYVVKGLLRSYTIDEKGKEHIFMFASEDWLMSDIESQVFDKTAELYIDALEDSEIEMIDRKAFRKVNAVRYFDGDELNKLLKRVAVLQKRVLLLMSATAMERYEHFLETYPGIVQRVPQKMIASYLGITPEGLSKIRGQRVKGKS
jgi:CRP-like cAMP-binding protein